MARKKLTMKEKGFVKSITDSSNKETFQNATQSIMRNYNVSSTDVAKSMGYENLTKPHIIEAIEKRIAKKEDIQHTLTTFTEKLHNAVKDNVTVENVPLIRELREYGMANAKLSGFIVDKQLNLNVNVDRSKELDGLTPEELQQEVMKRMSDTSVSGGGEGVNE